MKVKCWNTEKGYKVPRGVQFNAHLRQPDTCRSFRTPPFSVIDVAMEIYHRGDFIAPGSDPGKTPAYVPGYEARSLLHNSANPCKLCRFERSII